MQRQINLLVIYVQGKFQGSFKLLITSVFFTRQKKNRTMGGAENTSQLVMKRRSWIDVLTHVTHLYEKKLIAHRNMNDYSSFAW